MAANQFSVMAREAAAQVPEMPRDSGATPVAAPFKRLQAPALWLLVLVLLATVLLWVLDIRTRWEPPYLNFYLHMTLVGPGSLAVAALALLAFRRAGSWPVLWLGAGSLTFGMADLLGYAFLQWLDVDTAVSANNLSVHFSAWLHVLGAFFAFNRVAPRDSHPGRLAAILQVYLGSLAVVVCITLAALHGLLPPFFVQGQGGTPWRGLVTAGAGVLFLVAGLAFLAHNRRATGGFVYWYGLGLLLIALAMAGTWLTTATGTLLSWLVRITQLLSGVYLVVAALVTMRQARARKMRPEEVLASFFRQRETNLRLLFESVKDAIIITDPDGNITGWNPAAEAVYGWQAAEVIGRPVAMVLQTEFPPGFDQQKAHDDLAGLGRWSMEVVQRHRHGREIVVLSSASVLKDESGQVVGVVEVNRDVTERRRAEEALRTALADKDALLREVHHRVKNNLQMLCDLMYLQMEAMPDREQHQDLQDAYSRIYAIARLHEQLYQSMASGGIRLEEYLRRLAGGFENVFPGVPVKVEGEADGISLDLDRAIHIGLIVNELVTNALKHAFPKGQRGEVAVAVRTLHDQAQVQVRDNGRGLPADLDLEHVKSVGLRTVYILAKRLNATLNVGSHGGTSFTITFPLKADEPIEPRRE